MKQLSICGKQQQMTYNHFWHETFVHMWQTTANDIQAFSTWNSYHRWQTTANETQASLTWKSCPYVANNSKWHTIIFDMKHLSICDKQQQMTYKHFRHETVTIGGKQQQMKHKHLWHERVIHMWQQQQKTYNHVWHETVIHVLCIYLFKIYFTFLISHAVKLTIYTGRKTKIFTYNIRN